MGCREPDDPFTQLLENLVAGHGLTGSGHNSVAEAASASAHRLAARTKTWPGLTFAVVQPHAVLQAALDAILTDGERGSAARPTLAPQRSTAVLAVFAQHVE